MDYEIREVADATQIPGLSQLSNVSKGGQDVFILPRRATADESTFSTNSDAVIKLLKENGISSGRVPSGGTTLFRDERSFTWLGPVLFFSAVALAENPHAVSVALSVVANYLSDLFRGRTSSTRAKMEIVVEQEGDKTYKHLVYDGSVDGLKELAAAIDDMVK